MEHNMNLYGFSILLTVLSNVAYHFCQKEIRADAPPFYSLAASYVVGLFMTVLVILFLPGLAGGSGWKGFEKVGWASYALGIGLVGLELGFLLAYRAGWKISFAALVSNVAVTLVLIPIGLIIYREAMTPSKVVGAVFSLVGLWLLSKK
jgi:hypothetical protein